MNPIVHIFETDVKHVSVVKSHATGTITADRKMFFRISVGDEILMKEHDPRKPEHLLMICHRLVIQKELLPQHKAKLILKRI